MKRIGRWIQRHAISMLYLFLLMIVAPFVAWYYVIRNIK
jgi:hypothetical protein